MFAKRSQHSKTSQCSKTKPKVEVKNKLASAQKTAGEITETTRRIMQNNY